LLLVLHLILHYHLHSQNYLINVIWTENKRTQSFHQSKGDIAD
jgi:hypothetical protein